MRAVQWEFWVDRGGTFTDIVARRPDGTLVTHKLLSDNPRRYDDAAVAGIRALLGLDGDEPIDAGLVDSVKMGTTVATNALLERQGEPTVLAITAGFGDALRIGYQARPDIFALDIELPEMVYGRVVEIDERVDAAGVVLRPLDSHSVRRELQAAHDDGYRSVAIVCMHGYRHPAHERQVAEIAATVGFTQISVGHQVSPLQKLVSRGDTTVVDAYLSPVLRRYVDGLGARITAPLAFMQSNGGLCDASLFHGKDALLSGPAGGVVGMVATAEAAGYGKLIGFDMGGTSTDVSHYAGAFERTTENELAGVRVRAPMMRIHTVAAGGGSVVVFDGARLRVGPRSAGADPGPVCYGNDGPLAITDCNVMVGKLQPDFFPAVFGPKGSAPLDGGAVANAMTALADRIGDATGIATSAVDVAEGAITIAVDSMANAIKKISVERGHDVADHALVCFGGAGGQHACLVADRLGIETVLIHPLAGVLSALGMGLASIRAIRHRTVGRPLDDSGWAEARRLLDGLDADARAEVAAQPSGGATPEAEWRAALRYAGSDTPLLVPFDDAPAMAAAFVDAHRNRFGFVVDQEIWIERIEAEAIASPPAAATMSGPPAEDHEPAEPLDIRPVVMAGTTVPTPFYERSALASGQSLVGPAVIVEETATTVVEPGWTAETSSTGDLVLRRHGRRRVARVETTARPDPVQLEVFNNLFMHVAEEMGVVLENTAVSVNIKERLDFSCAVFDPDGELVANAPHMPVHLGSMSQSIKTVAAMGDRLLPGDVRVLNAPYNGGTHLPDITVIKPVFDTDEEDVIFFVAARGHHADIGGVTPGSAPPFSTTVDEEGVLIDNELLVRGGRFLDAEIRALLDTGPHPARNPDQNVADLKAQVGACERGAEALRSLIDHYGLAAVHEYMRHVRDNAEESVRRLVGSLGNGRFSCRLDDGSKVAVDIRIDHERRAAVIDFTGTSPVHPGNFNAPAAVCHAAVLYVFRCLVDDDIPLNAGCLVPLEIVLPDPCMLNPRYPAAVIAGNVETSQLIVDTLFGALEVMGAAQGTMNNFIWGNDRYQYYETICGGAGATPRADGCDAVHTHMTNSRLTDPEVLESRYPVVLESFTIRRGSGGDGTHRGGDGVVRRLRFGEPMTVSLLTGRRLVAPYGMRGGHDGAVGRNRVIRSDGTEEPLGGVAATDVGAGDVVEIATPGGGGWGDPERHP